MIFPACSLYWKSRSKACSRVPSVRAGRLVFTPTTAPAYHDHFLRWSLYMWHSTSIYTCFQWYTYTKSYTPPFLFFFPRNRIRVLFTRITICKLTVHRARVATLNDIEGNTKKIISIFLLLVPMKTGAGTGANANAGGNTRDAREIGCHVGVDQGRGSRNDGASAGRPTGGQQCKL